MPAILEPGNSYTGLFLRPTNTSWNHLNRIMPERKLSNVSLPEIHSSKATILLVNFLKVCHPHQLQLYPQYFLVSKSLFQRLLVFGTDNPLIRAVFRVHPAQRSLFYSFSTAPSKPQGPYKAHVEFTAFQSSRKVNGLKEVPRLFRKTG